MAGGYRADRLFNAGAVQPRSRGSSHLDGEPAWPNAVFMSLAQLLLPGVFTLLLPACSGVGRPAVTPQPASITGVSASGLELGVELLVENPNPFPLVAQGVEGTLFLGAEKRVGTGSATLDQPVPANGSGSVQSTLDIAWSSAGALREFVGKSEVPYTFKGALGVSGGPLQLSVPFELRGQLSREQVLSIGGSLLTPLLR
jgi:LEA14-like dessication related protein